MTSIASWASSTAPRTTCWTRWTRPGRGSRMRSSRRRPWAMPRPTRPQTSRASTLPPRPRSWPRWRFIPDQRLPQGAQQRDGASHRRLVVQVYIAVLSRLVEPRPVLGQQRLARAGDTGAVPHRSKDQGASRLDATNDLDDDVGPGDQIVRVGGEQRGVDTGGRTILARAPD